MESRAPATSIRHLRIFTAVPVCHQLGFLINNSIFSMCHTRKFAVVLCSFSFQQMSSPLCSTVTFGMQRKHLFLFVCYNEKYKESLSFLFQINRWATVKSICCGLKCARSTMNSSMYRWDLAASVSIYEWNGDFLWDSWTRNHHSQRAYPTQKWCCW